jgi:hypothetical protein
MTRDEFLAFLDASNTASPAPILMADGRMGLCNHWTATEILVDVYGLNHDEPETKRVPFGHVYLLLGKALVERMP